MSMPRPAVVLRQKSLRICTRSVSMEPRPAGRGLLNRRDARGKCAALVFTSSGFAADTSKSEPPSQDGRGAATGLAALGSEMRRHRRRWQTGHRERRKLSPKAVRHVLRFPRRRCRSCVPARCAGAFSLVLAVRPAWHSAAVESMRGGCHLGRLPGSCVPCEDRSTPTALYLP